MKWLAYILLATSAFAADLHTDLQLSVNPTGPSADGQVITSSYDFAGTPFGQSTTVTARLRNTSANTVYFIRALFTNYGADNPVLRTGPFPAEYCLPTGSLGYQDFTLSFTPPSADGGPFSSPLEIGYVAFPSSTGCNAQQNVNVGTLVTLNGSPTQPTLQVSLAGNLFASGSLVDFGNNMLGTTKSLTFTVKNSSTTALPNPSPQIVAGVFEQSPFSLGPIDNWPATLNPGDSASFTVNYAPAQLALVTATLNLSSFSYPLQGVGIAGPGLSSLLVSYTLPTGARYSVTPATPIDFGSALTGSTQSFFFGVSNPALNFASQTIKSVSISGAGFSLAGLPSLPFTVKPGDQPTYFNVIYAPTDAGAQTATLTIDTLVFTITAKATAPSLNPTFQFTPSTFTSGQQVQLSIQVPAAPTVPAIGTLALSFISAINNVTDDAAIVFTATGGRNNNVTFSGGSTAGAFANGQSTATFQTGSTAGTLKFTLTFATGEVYTKAVDIAPGLVQLSSATATKQDPNLVLNLTGIDNTYSAGRMTFNFYDSSGNLLTPGGISLDETTDFHSYFFTNNQAGGAFTLQAKFPVVGDLSTIAGADVTIQNSSGKTQTQRLPF